MILSPSLLSAKIGNLEAELHALEAAGLQWVHWDIMDGHFVPNITFGQHVIHHLRPYSSLFFDVHLMISNPERYILDFHTAGANLLVVHVEATIHLQRAVAEIRRLGMKAGVALNPATSLSVLEYILDDIDLVLLMSVNPGFGGQHFLFTTYKKIYTLHKMIDERKKTILIQVDGGVTLSNTKALLDAGADVLVCGSAFFVGESYIVKRSQFESIANSITI